MSVRIVTDSACDMRSEEHSALTVLPISVIFGDTVYQDGVDLSHDEFFELLVEGEHFPSTGQINPFVYGEAFEKMLEGGDDLVVVTLSSKLSGTYQSAVTAAAELEPEKAARVHVVDSLNVTVGQHILVNYALRLVDEGRTAAQIAAELERVREDIVLIGLLDTLEYLRRGGRISNAAGAVGEMLSIKPLVTVADGEVGLLAKTRGLKNGRKMLTKQIEKAGGIDFSMPVEVGYSGTSDENMRKYLEESADVFSGCGEQGPSIHSVGACIGTHVGPGAIALAFFKRG